MEVKVCTSEKGKSLLVIDGYTFCFQKMLAKDTVKRWQCSKRTCKAFLKTKSTQNQNIITESVLHHNHEKLTKDVFNRKLVSNSAKRKAISDICEKPLKIIRSEINKKGIDTFTSKDIVRVRQNIYNARTSNLIKLPKKKFEFHTAIESSPIVTNKNESFLLNNDKENNILHFSRASNSKFLNVNYKENIPQYEPDDYIEPLFQPKCSYCGINYKNNKLLALHEITHMSIELGEKVDNPILWHESRDDSFIRNKWLTSEDDIIVEEETEIKTEMMDLDAMKVEPEEEEEEESLLIPIGSSEQRDGSFETTREIILNEGKPYVDGLPLCDYAKEESRAFYHSMRIGGVNKRFCMLCRYSFKGNWAIESHYFAMACYYTCRYCGMRFNKQRNRFDEHIEGHVRNGDQYSNKVFAASKNNNIVPKVLYPKKRQSGADSVDAMMIAAPASVKNLLLQQKQFSENRTKQDTNYQRQAQLPKLQSQQNQPQLQISQSNTGHQAYFCGKCYKVFFKLDEFSIHSKNCDFNEFSNYTVLGNYSTSASKTKDEPPQLNSGEPIRNCAKDTGPYRDEVYIPEHILKDQLPNTGPPPEPYICYICNTPFPTIYSRNGHMRIHKAENLPPSTSQPPQQMFKSSGGYKNSNSTNVAHLADVKQESLDLEAEVEINEEVSQENFSINFGPAVSITLIQKNSNQKLQIDPKVMKLVQNNPQLSIKDR